jgi:hypothetical protein
MLTRALGVPLVVSLFFLPIPNLRLRRLTQQRTQTFSFHTFKYKVLPAAVYGVEAGVLVIA